MTYTLSHHSVSAPHLIKFLAKILGILHKSSYLCDEIIHKKYHH